MGTRVSADTWGSWREGSLLARSGGTGEKGVDKWGGPKSFIPTLFNASDNLYTEHKEKTHE